MSDIECIRDSRWPFTVTVIYRGEGILKKAKFRCSTLADRDLLISVVRPLVRSESLESPRCNSARETDPVKASVGQDSVKVQSSCTLAIRFLANLIERKQMQHRVNALLAMACVRETLPQTFETVSTAVTPRKLEQADFKDRLDWFALYLGAVVSFNSRAILQASFYRWQQYSAVSIQSEALEAAESLAALNIECLRSIDELPLKVGLKNISHMSEMHEFKLKLHTFFRLRSS